MRKIWKYSRGLHLIVTMPRKTLCHLRDLEFPQATFDGTKSSIMDAYRNKAPKSGKEFRLRYSVRWHDKAAVEMSRRGVVSLKQEMLL